ncbi:glutathione S-transferase-like isoform X2 [Acanthaster planci]|uniref:glutathione transferase n=1 Tax=Acanthaster planci TaxID=133434 RepID=A0A8B7ZYA7_ACAPL|nr:glutathione S-transferase-like isoform X2 [Acanthaster planci]
MSQYRVLYFNIKGKAQLIRLLLHDQGIAFTDDVIDKKDWPAMKPTLNLAFGQMPAFWDGDFQLVQTGAILRYLSRKHGTYGSNDTEASLIDMAYDGIEDFYQRYIRMVYDNFANRKEKFLAEMVPNVILPTLQKLLMTNKNGEGFLVGDKISFADYHLFQFLDALMGLSASACLEAFPVMKAYYERIKARPGINKFLASDLNQKRTFNNAGH